MNIEAVYISPFMIDHGSRCYTEDETRADGWTIYTRTMPEGGEFDVFDEAYFDTFNEAYVHAVRLANKYGVEILGG